MNARVFVASLSLFTTACAPSFPGRYTGILTENWTDMGMPQEASEEMAVTVEETSKTDLKVTLDVAGRTCDLTGTFTEQTWTMAGEKTCAVLENTMTTFKTGGAQLAEESNSMPITRMYTDRSGKKRSYQGTTTSTTTLIKLTFNTTWVFNNGNGDVMGTSTIKFEGRR